MNWQGRCLSKQARSGQTSRLYFKSARGCCDPRLRPGRGRSADTLAPTRARLTRRGHAGPRAGTLVWTRAHLTRRGQASTSGRWWQCFTRSDHLLQRPLGGGQ